MKKIIFLLMACMWLAACKKEVVECPQPEPVPAQSVNPVEGFWFYEKTYTWYGNTNWYSYPYQQAVGNRFILFDSDSVTIYLDDCSFNNNDAGIVRKAYYTRTDGTIVLNMQPEYFYHDSIYYPAVNGDTLTLQTRGYEHPSPNVNDSVYDKLYFIKH